YFGERSMKITATAAASDVGFFQPLSHRFNVTEDELYTASLYVLNPAINSPLQVVLGFEFFNGSGTSLGTTWAPQYTEVAADGEWFRVALIGVTAPESATKAALHFQVTNSIPISTEFYVDAVLIEEDDTLNEYFDGT